MSRFNSYAQRVNTLAKETFEEIQNTEAAYKAAEEKKRATPVRNGFVDAQYAVKASKANAEYLEAKENYDRMRRNLPDQKRREVAAIRRELEQDINDFFAADPAALDMSTIELMKSGILKPDEYARLMDAAEKTENATMIRMIGQYAAEMAENTKDSDTARLFRAVSYRSNGAMGKSYLEAFDAMAYCFDRCMNNTSMIKHWDELNSSIIANF